MFRHAIRTCVTAALLVTVAGCANKPKQRISLLENANKNLTGRLNLTATELEQVRQDQLFLDQRLQRALAEAQDLRGQLADQAAAPVQQPVVSSPVAPGWTAVPGGAMIAIEGNVLFTPGNAALRKEARRTLDAVVSAIQSSMADKDVLVLGHTDDRPIKKSGWVDNYQLSTERALAVVRYLRDRGLDDSRLIAGGCGEHRPVVEGTSVANRSKNRRVEIFALTPLPRRAQP